MIVTKAEAKKKWCPFVELNPANEDNLDVESNRAWRCVTDRCMAWRPTNEDTGFCGLAGQPTGTVAQNETLATRSVAQPQQPVVNPYIEESTKPVSLTKPGLKPGAIDMAPTGGGGPNTPVQYNTSVKPKAESHMDLIKQMAGLNGDGNDLTKSR